MTSKSHRAFVLRCNEYRDSDLIVHLLENDGSLIVAIARGARNSKKRFGGACLEPLNYIEYKMKDSKQVESSELAEASLVHSFDNLRIDYDRLITALKCTKLVLFVSQEGLEDINIFNLYGNTIRFLEETKNKTEKVYWHFVCRLLSRMGDLETHPVLVPLLSKGISEIDYDELSESQWGSIVNLLNTNFQSNYNKDLTSI